MTTLLLARVVRLSAHIIHVLTCRGGAGRGGEGNERSQTRGANHHTGTGRRLQTGTRLMRPFHGVIDFNRKIVGRMRSSFMCLNVL